MVDDVRFHVQVKAGAAVHDAVGGRGRNAAHAGDDRAAGGVAGDRSGHVRVEHRPLRPLAPAARRRLRPGLEPLPGGRYRRGDPALATGRGEARGYDRTIDSLRSALEAAGVEFIRSEEHTSELQALMRTSYAVFCLKKTTINTKET